MGEKKKSNGHDRNYAIRVFAYTMFAGFNGVETILIAYMSYYLTNSLFLAAGVVGALVAAAKVFDGFSDVIAGFLIDRTHTRWGKGRPYSLFAVAMWISVVLLFSASAAWSDGLKCAYVFVTYLLTDTVFRTLVVSADPVHYRHGFNKKEQIDSVAIWGTAGGFISVLAGIGIPILVNIYQFQDHGWTIIALVLAVPASVFSLLKFFCIPETQEVEEEETKAEEKLSVKDSLKYLMHNKYIFIFGIALLLVIVLQSMGAIQTYYFTYIIGDLGKLSIANTFSMASLLATPFYPMLISKFGKRRTAVTCFTIGGIVSLLAIFFTTNYVALGIIYTVRMIGFGSINVMTHLYTIDCMKYTEWKDGVKLEGVVAAVVSLATKIGAAVTLLITGVALEMFGYDGSLAVQPESALNAIWWMYIILPALIMFACAIIMYFFKVEKDMPQIERELAERAAAENK